jgi:hypothetical protein
MAHPDVLFAAAQGALGLGRHDVAEQLSASASEFHRHLIRAELAAIADDRMAAAELYDSAWALAAEERDKIAYWLSASSRGFDLHGTYQLDARNDELPALVHGGRHLATDHPGQAIAVLRPIMHSEHVRALLVDAYVAAGDIHAAVADLEDMARRFARPRHLVRAVAVLLQSGRREEAVLISDEALRRTWIAGSTT